MQTMQYLYSNSKVLKTVNANTFLPPDTPAPNQKFRVFNRYVYTQFISSKSTTSLSTFRSSEKPFSCSNKRNQFLHTHTKNTKDYL